MSRSYVKPGYKTAYPAMAKGGMVKKTDSEKAEKAAGCGMKAGGLIKKKPAKKSTKK